MVERTGPPKARTSILVGGKDQIKLLLNPRTEQVLNHRFNRLLVAHFRSILFSRGAGSLRLLFLHIGKNEIGIFLFFETKFEESGDLNTEFTQKTEARRPGQGASGSCWAGEKCSAVQCVVENQEQKPSRFPVAVMSQHFDPHDVEQDQGSQMHTRCGPQRHHAVANYLHYQRFGVADQSSVEKLVQARFC